MEYFQAILLVLSLLLFCIFGASLVIVEMQTYVYNREEERRKRRAEKREQEAHELRMKNLR